MTIFPGVGHPATGGMAGEGVHTVVPEAAGAMLARLGGKSEASTGASPHPTMDTP